MMSRFLRVVAALAALALGSRGVEAQEASPGSIAGRLYPRFEMAVLAGYRFESTLTFQDAARYARIEIDDAPTFGITFGYNFPNLELEFQYSYANPAATAIAQDPGNPNRAFFIGVHDFQVGWLVNGGSPGNRVRPYLGLAGGATILNANQDIGDSVRPSFSVSAGVKAYLSDHVGLRAEIHYIPAYLYTTGDGVELCFEEGCWNTGDRYLQQFDVRAGATFRF